MSHLQRKPAVLAFNVGNTNVQWAQWDGSAFGPLSSKPTALFRLDDIPEGVPCAVASVVPAVEALFRQRGAFILSSKCACGVDFSKMDASTLGADRVANAVALASSGPLPALCVDLGTAITFELLDESACLLGGSIMPGRALQRRALNEHTAKLPLAPLSKKPPSMPGRDTLSAIALGVDLGAVGAVGALLVSAASLFPGRSLRTVACGGDAPFFLQAMPGALEPAGELFTLSGLVKAWEMNKP